MVVFLDTYRQKYGPIKSYRAAENFTGVQID
jgi:hypothetical protein